MLSQEALVGVKWTWNRGRRASHCLTLGCLCVARELGVDIKTVRKWCIKAWVAQKRPARGRVLDRYQSFLRARAAEVGFNAVVLYRELAAQGYEGSYAAVAICVSVAADLAGLLTRSEPFTEPPEEATQP